MELLISLLSCLGLNGVLLFFVKRYFSRRDKREREREEHRDELFKQLETSMDTLRLLSYSRMSEEIERLLSKGYATPQERHILQEMHNNYKAHGWNGDMDARLSKVHALRTDHPPND